ncbi:hypothetical protein ACFE04_029485 [Oxalis oulophora]
MKSIQYFLCFVLFLAVFPTKSLSKNSDLISKTCDVSKSKDFCKSFLEKHGGSNATDFQSLSAITLKLANSQVLNILNQIDAISNKTSPRDKVGHMLLESCTFIFKGAIFSINEAGEALRDKKYVDARMGISYVSEDGTNCDDTYEQFHRVSPLTDMSNVLQQICDIELAIIAILSRK